MMAAYAPDAGKQQRCVGSFILSVFRVVREERRGGAKDFHITGDVNAQLGMMCTDEKDIEELSEMMCGLLCWQGYDKDPGGFKKLVWYGIMKEFNCKATSTCSKWRRAKETAFTHKHFKSKKQEETSQVSLHHRTRRKR